MASIVISESEILEALAKAGSGSGPEDARTIRELEAATGIGHQRIRKALRIYQQKGRLVVHKAYRAALDGAFRHVPTYTILPQKKRR